jgi:murein DD-endopeptidase MepM/ murein hydrolase activator NlpD
VLRAALLATFLTVVPAIPPVGAAGTWVWPVRGPIVRGFDPPASPYGAGHRGIDIAAPAGTQVAAPAPGVVSFAGRVAGQLFVSIDHGAGLVSTASYLSATLVAEDEPVVAGQPVALTGMGHTGASVEHMHFGVRLGGIYVDPLEYLGPTSLVGILWLAPITPAGPPAAAPAAPGAAPVLARPVPP